MGEDEMRKLQRMIIEAIVRRNGGDAGYLLNLHAISPRALRRLGAAARMLEHREAVPVDAAYAAQLVGALAEGCGSCVQIHVDMARKAGVGDEQIAAILQNGSASADVALAMRFARAIMSRSADEEPARQTVRTRWGDKGVVDLTIATQTSRFLSMLKRGFGYATECGPLIIGGRNVTPVREAA
jgi:AhpD family alkylhydroperoxidase